MKSLDQRIAEIKALPWAEIRDLAEALTPPIEKPDDQAWKDMAESIAIAEGYTNQVEPVTAPEPQPVGLVVALEPIRGNYCPNCKSKLLTGLQGESICPLKLVECPRNA